jgi:formylmethanofuran dehydrogenase subunit C
MPTLKLIKNPKVPLEAECISPDVFAKLSLDAIRALLVFHGKRQVRLDKFFEVSGSPGEQIELQGDCTKVKWLGKGMSFGTLKIQGHAGMHLGAYMSGGRIDVLGNVTDWLGGEMSGGDIHVRGNVGGQVASAYRGSANGMSGGTILVEGSAGIELGMRMKKGLVVVKGPVRDFAGLQMKGGTIILMSGAELRTGAWMERGTIISLCPLRLMPTFAYSCVYSPIFLNIYSRKLSPLGFELPIDPAVGCYQRYAGDSSAVGKGELLVWHPIA